MGYNTYLNLNRKIVPKIFQEWHMRQLFAITLAAALVLAAQAASAAEEYRFDFENGDEGWQIPDWVLPQKDHKAESTEVSTDFASTGTHSLSVMCDFPGTVWAAALVEKEFEGSLDLYGYHNISVDVYLPKTAPSNLILARIILTVGDGWLFTEMRFPVLLQVGKWTTVSAKLESYEVPDSVWKGREEKRLFHNINKVKKVAVRIEYDASQPYRLGPRYHGPIYIDNMVIKPGGPGDLPPPATPGVVPDNRPAGAASSVSPTSEPQPPKQS